MVFFLNRYQINQIVVENMLLLLLLLLHIHKHTHTHAYIYSYYIYEHWQNSITDYYKSLKMLTFVFNCPFLLIVYKYYTQHYTKIFVILFIRKLFDLTKGIICLIIIIYHFFFLIYFYYSNKYLRFYLLFIPFGKITNFTHVLTLFM